MRIPGASMPPTIESLPSFQPLATPATQAPAQVPASAPVQDGLVAESSFDTQQGPDLLGGMDKTLSPKEGLQRGIGLGRLYLTQGTAANPALSPDPAAATDTLAGSRTAEGTALAKAGGGADVVGLQGATEAAQTTPDAKTSSTKDATPTELPGRLPGSEKSDVPDRLREPSAAKEGSLTKDGGKDGLVKDGASFKEGSGKEAALASQTSQASGQAKAALGADGMPLAKGAEAAQGQGSNPTASGLGQTTEKSQASGTANAGATSTSSQASALTEGSTSPSSLLGGSPSSGTVGKGTAMAYVQRNLTSTATATGASVTFSSKGATIQDAFLQSMHAPSNASSGENPRAELRQLFQQWASARETQMFQSFQAMMPMDAVGFARKMAELVRQGHVPHQDLLALIAKTLKRPGNRKLVSKIKDMMIKKGMVSSSISTEQLELIAAMVALALAKGGSLEAEDLVQDLFDSPSRKLELPDGGGEHHQEGREQQREDDRKEGSEYKKQAASK